MNRTHHLNERICCIITLTCTYCTNCCCFFKLYFTHLETKVNVAPAASLWGVGNINTVGLDQTWNLQVLQKSEKKNLKSSKFDVKNVKWLECSLGCFSSQTTQTNDLSLRRLSTQSRTSSNSSPHLAKLSFQGFNEPCPAGSVSLSGIFACDWS